MVSFFIVGKNKEKPSRPLFASEWERMRKVSPLCEHAREKVSPLFFSGAAGSIVVASLFSLMLLLLTCFMLVDDAVVTSGMKNDEARQNKKKPLTTGEMEFCALV